MPANKNRPGLPPQIEDSVGSYYLLALLEHSRLPDSSDEAVVDDIIYTVANHIGMPEAQVRQRFEPGIRQFMVELGQYCVEHGFDQPKK